MIPFGSETVTVISRTEVTETSGKRKAVYTKRTLRGCSWRRRTETNRMDMEHSVRENVSVRVPKGQEPPNVGDLMIYGEYSAAVTSSADYERIIEAKRSTGGAFFVQSVSDNTLSAPIPHYHVTGG